ncbi:MAG: hypothetical protein H8E12_10570 [Rhodobacteraceae bacterium]|nr:hypothetical protein [Paracoccaceae bacterium]
MFTNFLILLLSLPTYAQDSLLDPGSFTILGQRQCAPFDGVLFDINATASLLTLPNYYASQCKATIDFRLGEQDAEHQLEITNLNIRLNVVNEQYATAVTQKDLEIDALQTALTKNSFRNHWLWAAGGVVVGSVATIAIVETVTR